MVKKIIFGLVVIGIVGGIYGYFQYNKEHRNIAAEKATLTIDAVDLFKAYSENEASANSTYLDKVIIVEGTVIEIAVSGSTGMVVLGTEDDFFGVNVYFDNLELMSAINMGNNIKIKGQCTGGDEMGVVMAHSSVVKNTNK